MAVNITKVKALEPMKIAAYSIEYADGSISATRFSSREAAEKALKLLPQLKSVKGICGVLA